MAKIFTICIVFIYRGVNLNDIGVILWSSTFGRATVRYLSFSDKELRKQGLNNPTESWSMVVQSRLAHVSSYAYTVLLRSSS